MSRCRKLQQEETEINTGGWDAKLTEGYDLITPSEEPAQAIYKHRLSAGTIEAAKSSIESDAAALSSKQADAPVPKEEAASPAKELQFADEVIIVPDSTQDRAASSIDGEGTAGSGLQNVPEEDPDFANAKNADDKEETVNSTRISKRSSVPPASLRPTSTSSSSKPAVPERRSSSRVSRASIANLSEIIPSASAPEAGDSTPNLSAAPLAEDIASPSRDVIPPSSEGMDVDTQSIPMERDDSRDSTGPGAAGTAATAAGKKTRPARKSSVPPVTAKDANKRKRTTTPQAQTKTTSPGPADRSKYKRVKTEEPESSLGTPGA